MNDTKIEWADVVWNPVTGCSKISEGCQNCYAERMAKRLAGRYGYPVDEPFRVTFHPGKINRPYDWKRPLRVFVNSMGDLYHDEVPFEWIDDIMITIAHCRRQHTFMILTKRPERMKEYFDSRYQDGVWFFSAGFGAGLSYTSPYIPNLWLGVTVENQEMADTRIPILLQIPAAVRFVSIEPMLGPVYFRKVPGFNRVGLDLSGWWIICGGETGPNARPMHPDWVRSLRAQCQTAGVPFFFKQWGEWKGNYPGDNWEPTNDMKFYYFDTPGYLGKVWKCGTKTAGHLLDGQEWRQFPGDPR